LLGHDFDDSRPMPEWGTEKFPNEWFMCQVMGYGDDRQDGNRETLQRNSESALADDEEKRYAFLFPHRIV
jgi:hypothetical protein